MKNLPANIEVYAADVHSQAHTLMVMLCRDLGPEHRATVKALEILTQAADIVQEKQMQQEQTAPDRFSLANLHVHADTLTNSETPYEDD